MNQIYKALLDSIYGELVLQRSGPTKDIRIEWEMEESAVIRIEDDEDALRIIIEKP